MSNDVTFLRGDGRSSGVVASILKPLLDTVIAVQSISSVYLVKLEPSQLQLLMLEGCDEMNREGDDPARPTPLAVKRIDKRGAAVAGLDAAALGSQEATVLKRFGSPFDFDQSAALGQPPSLRQFTQSRVPLLYAFDEDAEFVYLAMSYKRGCQLQRLFFGHASLSLPFILHIVRQVAFILKGLHTEFKVAYRDLKLSNLHIDPLGHVSLVDFGLSLLTDAEGIENVNRCVGTKHIRAPELYLTTPSESWSPFSGDFWSFGVMCWELTFRDPPFPEGFEFSSDVLLGANGKPLVEGCFDENRNPKIAAFLAKGAGSNRYREWLSLIKQLLSPLPGERCGCDWDAVLSHPALAAPGQDPLALRYPTAPPCVRPFVEEIEDQLLGL
jgi:serine/threonine protein kinase